MLLLPPPSLSSAFFWLDIFLLCILSSWVGPCISLMLLERSMNETAEKENNDYVVIDYVSMNQLGNRVLTVDLGEVLLLLSLLSDL
jgi:hypothetical protein